LNFNEQHKALIITTLIIGTLLLGMFSFQLRKHQNEVAEIYYEIEPEPEKPKEELKVQEDENVKTTNKAFNEDAAYKEMMRNFKAVTSNDFERTTKAIEDAKAAEAELEKQLEEATNESKTYANNTSYALNSEDKRSYKVLQNTLKQSLKNKKQADEHAKTKGTLTYSLKGRTLTHYKIPRYLCEKGGKIVVSIKVNAEGHVFDASINGSSNSDNQCLINHAIAYAKSVAFDASDLNSQIGTITFLFKGK